MPAATRGSRQGRAYGADEIEQLLRDALAGLMADGTTFRDLSVDRIVAAAGMARSTFYKYYADKAAMLEALSAGALRVMYADQRAWLQMGEDVTWEDIHAGMRPLFDHVLDDQAVFRAVNEAAAYDAAIRDAYVEGVRDYARALERFIKRGQKGGWIGDLHPATTATSLAWMVERTVSQEAPGASARRLDQLAAALTDTFWATLFTEPPAR